MNCKAILVRPKDNKELKSETISRDTYNDCEQVIKDRNEQSKRKDGAYWKIISINV